MRRVALSSCSTHSLNGFLLSKGSNLSSETFLQAMQASVVVVPSTISQEFKRFCRHVLYFTKVKQVIQLQEALLESWTSGQLCIDVPL